MSAANTPAPYLRALAARRRRPDWTVRTLLLEHGVAWSDVKAMAPAEGVQLLRALRSPTGHPSGSAPVESLKEAS